MEKFIYLFVLCFSIFISCDKTSETIYVDCIGIIEDINKVTDLNIGFTANLISTNVDSFSYATDTTVTNSSSTTSTGTTPLQINRYAHIYVYKSGYTPLTAPYISMGIFRSMSVGSLTSVSWPITLSRGTYDIYSAGSNYEGSDQGPDFFIGLASNLAQDVDYFWWKQRSVIITTANTIIPITYSHSCAQIVINFSASGTNVLSKISHVDITLGNTVHCNMSLLTGYISPSKSISINKTMMNIDNLTASVITLPISPASTSRYLTATILATVNNISSWYTLKVPLPSPSNSMTGGNSYIYSAVFGSTKSSDNIEQNEINAILEHIVPR